ncbi:SDR family oxidoreductase [Streptomyces profundus]|uniref:SDR family oxidoreductase n=1 Tax=Streptomyces profundus TaxID=2867410 RepID=UPI001D164645|nr:SDR family oxidoreductase [Streptomyces sp. MA3_2.13]UED84828.1 SDR family oxidoreductase [Streptomyces sp. MA3_2.13]
MELNLTDRVFVVTGGSKGLGRATADALVADGARVVVSARGQEAVEAAVAGLGADRAAGLTADLAEPEAAARLVALARERFGRFDGALVSVGGPPSSTAAGATDEQWRAAFETVFLGAVRAARTFAADLAAAGGGAIGLVLSSSARSPITGLGISNGLRPGLAMVAKDLADEFGPRGVRVLGLMPGRIATDRLRQLDAASDAAARQRTLDGIPLGRYGEPAEFGGVAAFLLSPAAAYVTGTTIPVDGGALRMP